MSSKVMKFPSYHGLREVMVYICTYKNAIALFYRSFQQLAHLSVSRGLALMVLEFQVKQTVFIYRRCVIESRKSSGMDILVLSKGYNDRIRT